jgi:hypothetical protein
LTSSPSMMIGRVEQSKIELAEESTRGRHGERASGRLVGRGTDQVFRGPSLPEQLAFLGIPRPLATIRLGKRSFDRAHARTLDFRRGKPLVEVDGSRHTHNLEASTKPRCDLVKLVALEHLTGGDTSREPPELGQRSPQPLLVGTSPQTPLVDVRGREEADRLGGNLSVTRPHELVQAVDEDVFRRKDKCRLPRREPDLRDFFGRSRKTRGCFDEEVVLGIDPVPPPPLTMQPKLRETLVDSRSVR